MLTILYVEFVQVFESSKMVKFISQVAKDKKIYSILKSDKFPSPKWCKVSSKIDR